jgi:predicted ATPase
LRTETGPVGFVGHPKRYAKWPMSHGVGRGTAFINFRGAMSMARLWRDHGKGDARELLAPVYGWFTEGFDTRDLKEAKTLLDELVS